MRSRVEKERSENVSVAEVRKLLENGSFMEAYGKAKVIDLKMKTINHQVSFSIY